MKKFVLLACVALLAVVLLAPAATYAQVRNVTFMVNTAAIPDTIGATSPVVITGSSANDSVARKALTDWGTGLALTNIGGDYWTKTIQVSDSARMRFKIRVNPNGWETSLDVGDRDVTVVSDTTLPLMFWNSGHFPAGEKPPQYSKPYTDTVSNYLTVYARVNIKGVQDNALNGYTPADVDSVVILGGGPNGSNLNWGPGIHMTREQAPTDGAAAGQFTIPAGSFYNVVIRIPKDSVTVGQDIAYKFRLGSNWNYGPTQRSEQLSGPNYDGGNRHFKIPVGKQDTTLQWVWFGDTKATGRANADTVVVNWRVDMTTARQKASFNIGDTLQVQSGWFNTADSVRTRRLTRQGVTNVYQGADTIVTSLNKPMDYQYYLVKGGNSIRENFFNFDYKGDVNSEAERRQFTPTSKNVTVWDTVRSVTSGRRQPYFENQQHLSRTVKVTWEVNLKPAYYQVAKGDTLLAGQGPTSVYKSVMDSIKVWGVGLNGPATGGPNGPLPTDWAAWNPQMVADTSARKMWDDGTHGDKVAGDTIYTVQFTYTTANTLGKVFKFGINGCDNESAFGLNHLENISDQDSVFTIHTQFGSINPNKYNTWDFTNEKPAAPTAVSPVDGLPTVYALGQNYPNPFNPSTKITFALPRQSQVELKVYNVLGQEVATLVNGVMAAGNHTVSFNARNLASGLYFYRIQAGDFSSIKKMMLLK